MRERKLSTNEAQKPTITLRRSPRFLHINQTPISYPQTPKPADRKTHTHTPLGSFSTPINTTHKNGCKISKTNVTPSKNLAKSRSRRSVVLDYAANLDTEKRVTRSSICGGRFVNNLMNEGEKVSTKGDGEVTKLECSRRSSRLVGRANVGKNDEALGSKKQFLVEKMVTRSSLRGDKFVDNDRKDRVGVEFVEKRVTHSASRTKTIGPVEKENNVSTGRKRKVVVLDESKGKGDGELLCTSERDVKKMKIGEKRKRCQVEKECEVIDGWSEEQEVALRRVYFTAKPTPHFWKKVAKMVPGKSAEECFDRIHSDHLTPSQPQTRSRAKTKEPSSLLFSASKLLDPIETKTKKLKSRRRTLVAQKTVRQLLQKQRNEDQDYKADLFSVLEPNIEPSSLDFQDNTVFASPVPNRGSSILLKCRDTSSSAHKKPLSRLNSSQKVGFASPLVLKQIKNKALHEKYIDQLHCRDAKRKAVALRNGKCVKDEHDKKTSHSDVNLVKVAKDALVFDAQDAITKLRNIQSSKNCDIDDDEISSNDDEDEDDEEL